MGKDNKSVASNSKNKTPPVTNSVEWTRLLQRTLCGNNWKELHPNFQTENFHFRKLKNTLDYHMDINNQVEPKENGMEEGEEEYEHWINHRDIQDSIQRHSGVWKAFMEEFSVQACLSGCFTEKDMDMVLQLYNRNVKLNIYRDQPEQADYRLLEIVADAFRRRTGYGDEEALTMDKAFGYTKSVGRQDNPFDIPDWAIMLRDWILDDGYTLANATRKLNDYWDKNGKPTKHETNIKKDWQKVKWLVLDEWFHDRVNTGTNILTDKELSQIQNYWDKIEAPQKLEVTADFIHYGIGTMKVKQEGVEVIKGKRSKKCLNG